MSMSIAKRNRIISFYHEHGFSATVKKYHLGSATLSRWRANGYFDRPSRSAAPHVSKANGIADAIIYLQHAQGALKDGEPLSNAELFALLALRTLTGEITK